MKAVKKTFLLVVALLGSNQGFAVDCTSWTDHTLRKLRSQDTVNLCAFEGKPLLIVNTASKCGFTPQFKGLEALHQKYKDRGLVVLGFPSDDFFQEEDDEKDTATVCYVNYGVTFTMFAPIAVRGSDVHPFFKYLGDQVGTPKWNFNKYLVSADRKIIQKFGSFTKPEDKDFIAAIEVLLTPELKPDNVAKNK